MGRKFLPRYFFSFNKISRYKKNLILLNIIKNGFILVGSDFWPTLYYCTIHIIIYYILLLYYTVITINSQIFG